jgi:hypothetical protein
MNHRKLTGLVVLGLAVAAVPTLTAAHTHYTGKVPASIALDPVAPLAAKPLVMTTVAPHHARTASHKKRTLTHKKKLTATKRAAPAKRHKKLHKAKPAA